MAYAGEFASDVASRIWAQAPAADHLYGGRMNEARRMEVVTVTKVCIIDVGIDLFGSIIKITQFI